MDRQRKKYLAVTGVILFHFDKEGRFGQGTVKKPACASVVNCGGVGSHPRKRIKGGT